MVKDNISQTEEVQPRSFPDVAPSLDLYATSDIRFVMMELAKYGERIDSLSKTVEKMSDKISSDIEKQGAKIAGLEKSVDRVRTGAIVAAAILSIVGAVFWWALGDRITAAVHAGLGPSAPISPAQQILPKNSN